jgi:hypothetical protein
MSFPAPQHADSHLEEQLGGQPTDQPVALNLQFGGLPLDGQRPAKFGAAGEDRDGR